MDTLDSRIETWFSAIRQDEECMAATQRLEMEIRFRFGNISRTLVLDAAEPEAACHIEVGISAPITVWENIFVARPRPGYQSFTALQRQCDEFRINATPEDVARSLHLLECLFEIARGDSYGMGSTGFQSPVKSKINRITGHHAIVSTPSAKARVFYERVGEGPALVMLHTAGADSRQFLGLLCDDYLVGNWSCYAFDLPLHGRSSPPDGWKWGHYRLTMVDYVDWCLAFISQVVGRPAVVMGCSMGASACIALAATGSPLVRSVVALEAPDRSPGRRNPYLRHPAVDSGDYGGAYVRGLMGPRSPQSTRRCAAWIYAQGGPGVYEGDLWFYSDEYDGLALAPKINTERCPVHLLTGVYDYSSPPEATKRLQEAIPGATLTVMPELGHFPMLEDPERFLDYVRPVLQSLHSE